MTIKPAAPETEEDVLLAFTAEASQDRATLEAYIARYPEHAEALAALAVEVMLAEGRRTSITETNDPAIDKAWEAYQSALPIETKSIGMAPVPAGNNSPM